MDNPYQTPGLVYEDQESIPALQPGDRSERLIYLLIVAGILFFVWWSIAQPTVF